MLDYPLTRTESNGAYLGEGENDIAASNIDFVQHTIEEKFSQLTTEGWRHCCEHVMKYEKDYLDADCV